MKVKKERIVFHGVNNLKIAKKILKEGFKPHTYFALHLEDALEFGGEYIFYVVLKCENENWQPRPSRSISANRITRLISTDSKELYENDNVRIKYFKKSKKYPCPNCGTDIGRVRLNILGRPAKPKCPKCKKSFKELFNQSEN